MCDSITNPVPLQSPCENCTPKVVRIYPYRGNDKTTQVATVAVLYAGLIFHLPVKRTPKRKRVNSYLPLRPMVELPQHARTVAKQLEKVAIEAWEARESAEKAVSDYE